MEADCLSVWHIEKKKCFIFTPILQHREAHGMPRDAQHSVLDSVPLPGALRGRPGRGSRHGWRSLSTRVAPSPPQGALPGLHQGLRWVGSPGTPSLPFRSPLSALTQPPRKRRFGSGNPPEQVFGGGSSHLAQGSPSEAVGAKRGAARGLSGAAGGRRGRELTQRRRPAGRTWAPG